MPHRGHEGLPDQRAIIDRRAVADRLAGLPAGEAQSGLACEVLAEALAEGRKEVARRLAEEPGNGRASAQATSFLHDQLVRLAYDFVVERMVGPPGDDLALIGLGGTGRGEMAPYSDIDLMFLVEKQPSPDQERAAEAVLHLLWDLKLKVGHSVRSVPQLLALAKKDMTIRTAFLEARWLWVTRALSDLPCGAFRKEVVLQARLPLRAKLPSTISATSTMADSRYVVEPNVKDGKGGLRDLQTLYLDSANMCTASKARPTSSRSAC